MLFCALANIGTKIGYLFNNLTGYTRGLQFCHESACKQNHARQFNDITTYTSKFLLSIHILYISIFTYFLKTTIIKWVLQNLQ